MFETILIAMLIAKIKGYKVKYLFTTWTMWPIFVLEILHILFQINIFTGNYFFIQFAPYLKKTYLFLCIIPIVVYKEYFAGLIGSAFVIAGTLLNNFVMAQNGGKMPVFPNFSYITGYANPQSFSKTQGIHILGTAQTKWWVLSDILDIGWSVLSIGDILIRCFVLFTVYYTVKALNNKSKDAINQKVIM